MLRAGSVPIAPLKVVDANSLEQSNLLVGQTWNLYNKRPASGIDWERMRFGWSADVLQMYSEANGTGVVRAVNIQGVAGSFLKLDGSVGSQLVFGTKSIVVDSAGTTFIGIRANVGTVPTLASAATIEPTTQVVFVSGTVAIATITPPAPLATKNGQITLIPTGLWATATTGNIALASTAVISKALIMTWDAGAAKWYPSY